MEGISLNHRGEKKNFFFWNPTRGEGKKSRIGTATRYNNKKGAWKRERGRAMDDAALTTPTPPHTEAQSREGKKAPLHTQEKKKFLSQSSGIIFQRSCFLTSTQKDRKAPKTKGENGNPTTHEKKEISHIFFLSQSSGIIFQRSCFLTSTQKDRSSCEGARARMRERKKKTGKVKYFSKLHMLCTQPKKGKSITEKKGKVESTSRANQTARGKKRGGKTRRRNSSTTVLVFTALSLPSLFQWGLCRLSSRIPLRLSGEGNRSAQTKNKILLPSLSLHSSFFADQPDNVISPSQLPPKHYTFPHKIFIYIQQVEFSRLFLRKKAALFERLCF